MALPISGPNQVSYNRPFPLQPTVSDEVWTRQYWRQKRPFDRPLPYLGGGAYRVSRVGYDSYWGTSLSANSAAIGGIPDEIYQDLLSKAYDKLKDKAFNAAQLSVSLAEMAQTTRSLRQRALQLSAFILALRQRKFLVAANILTMPEPPKKVGRIKSVAGQFLEFHLGWEQLIKDIGNSVDVLQQPIKNTSASAQALDQGYTEQSNWPPGPWSVGWQRTYKQVVVKVGAEFAVDNPNLFLANSMGFVNPLSVAWELVPFSFVLDWFINVGQVISSYTDFLGLSVQNGYTTTLARYTWVGRRGDPFEELVCNGWWTRRELGINKPTLHVKRWKNPSLTRAATAVSLLVGQLRSIR